MAEEEVEDTRVAAVLEDCNTAYDVSFDVLEFLVDRCGAILYENYLRRKELARVSDGTVGEVLNMLGAAWLPRGDGGLTEIASTWEPDQEPRPAQIDTWARGAIPTRKKPRPSTSGSKSRKSEAEEDDPAKVRSRKGMRRSTSSNKTVKRSPSSNAIKVKGDGARASTPTIIQRPKTPSQAQRGAGGKSPMMHVQGGEEEVSAEVRAIEETAKAEWERIAKLQKAQKDEDERFERLAKELKGKDYTFDAEGNVIHINPLPAEKLMSAVEMDIAIYGEDDEDMEDPAAQSPKGRGGQTARRQGQPSARRGKKTARQKRRKMGDAGQEEFFLQEVTRQPPLASTIRLASGVVLTEGKNRKRGPKVKEDPKHMSRKDFVQHQNQLEENGGSMIMREMSAMQGGPGQNDSGMADFNLAAGARMKSRRPEDGDDEKPKDENELLIMAGDWGANSATSSKTYSPSRVANRNKSGLHKSKGPRDMQTSPSGRRKHRIMQEQMDADGGDGFLPPISPTGQRRRRGQFAKEEGSKMNVTAKAREFLNL